MQLTNCFLKVRKATKARERGLISLDSICSIFEAADRKSLEVSTLDGFWFNIEGNIEEYDSVLPLAGGSCNERQPARQTKREFLKSKKMRALIPAEVVPKRENSQNFNLPTGVGEEAHDATKPPVRGGAVNS